VIGRQGEKYMKRMIISFLMIIVLTWATVTAAAKDIEIKGRQLISQKPPFTLSLPSELRPILSFSHENPEENSLTRIFFLIKEKDKQVEEMLILQIADRTNPQASPMTAPPLKPYGEKRMYVKDKKKRGELELDYLIQIMAWNPESSSLQPIRKRDIGIPSHWALQGQFLFIYQGEHAVFLRYSKDANAFGLRVSERGESWEKRRITGNEKRVVELFQKIFLDMIDSVQLKNP
jgi:hypothetical protein